ncbi:glycosyltransferase [Halomonas sp. ATBC28]|uniref:glycosyltransferase n=1 Tax=Halomonas sp. ATBC28 TaxID=2545264 RepID=UPI00110F2DEB|nr:glycosyltransferase [Halomonas sp. ATBC28]TMU23214.1 glycosyltransferase [Halomonas sp. ATBC28]
MKTLANTQPKALAAFKAARLLFQQHQFNKAREKAREYRRLIAYRRFSMTEQRITSSPVCSIIIVIHRASSDTLECIDRLQAQAGADRSEIIVVDNGGNEALHAELAKRSLLHIRCPYNFLPSEGRNIGAFFARAPLLIFVDDDGLPAEDYIQQAINALATPDTIGVRGRIAPRSPSGGMGSHYDLGNESKENASFNLEGNMAIKRSIFRVAGGFDPIMFGHEGHELADRCRRVQPQWHIRYWPGLVLQHDFAEGSRLGTKRARQALGEEYRAWLKTIAIPASVTQDCSSQHGITVVLHVKKGVELSALIGSLEPLACYKEHCLLEVLLLPAGTAGEIQELALHIVKHFAGRLACYVLPVKHWQQSTLPQRARYSTLLLAEWPLTIGPDELTSAVDVLEEEQVPWLALDDALSPKAVLLSLPEYLSACESSRGAPLFLKDFAIGAGHIESEMRWRLTQRLNALSIQQRLKKRQKLPNIWCNSVNNPSNLLLHTTPHFRDENLQPWRHLPDHLVSIAFIGSSALCKQLESVCRVFPLDLTHYADEVEQANIPSKCDLLLVESLLLSGNQQDYESECITWATQFKQASKPSAFWLTESLAHLPLLANLASHFDNTYAIEPASAQYLEQHLAVCKPNATTIDILSPCIASAHHNAIRQFKADTFENLHVLYDGWADLIEFEENRILLSQHKRNDLLIADSQWQFNQLKLNDFPEFSPYVLGYLSAEQKHQALKEFSILLITSRTLKSSIKLQQVVAEALAAKCRVLVYVHEDDVINLGPFGEYVEYYRDAGTLFERLQWFKENPWQCKGEAQRGWRAVHQYHTIQQRIDQLLEGAGSPKRVNVEPLVSCLTVTKRPQLIQTVIDNYERQSYSHKELLIALNSADVDIEAIKSQVLQAVPNARVFQIGSERNIGFCLNWLMQHARGGYWAKMDDDDEYGPHYLQDYVLNTQALDIDLMGKKMGPTYFEALEQTLYRDPASITASDFLIYDDNRHHMAGATFFGKHSLLKLNPFSEVRRSSVDVEFFRGALKKQLHVMLADDFNFTVFRAADKSHHTWKENDAALLNTAMPITRDHINV